MTRESLLKYDKILYCNHEDVMNAKLSVVEQLDQKDIISIKTVSDSYYGIHTAITIKGKKASMTYGIVDMSTMKDNGKGKHAWCKNKK